MIFNSSFHDQQQLKNLGESGTIKGNPGFIVLVGGEFSSFDARLIAIEWNILRDLKKRAERIFDATDSSISSNYYQQRLKLARKLGNPRLLEIGFHTFRHWKLTMVAHEFRDPFYVQEFAGHRDIKSTMLYIHLEKQIYQKGAAEEFHVATAKTVEDASKLVASGWEFVHEYQEVMIYRKRK